MSKPTIDRGKPGSWRYEVYLRQARLRDDAAASSVTGVTERLETAKLLANGWQSPLSWWSGSQVESAWVQLRLAEEELVQATTDGTALKAHGYSALAHARKAGLADDPRVAGLKKETEAGSPRAASVLEVLRVAHEVTDAQHWAQRAFRNQLRVVTVGLVALAVAGVWAVGAASPKDVIIPAPPELTSSWQAVAAAMVLGAVGALFSAIPSLAQMPWLATSAFNPVLEQAALKMMCALFGSTQEALTRFADHRAGAVSIGQPAPALPSLPYANLGG